MSGMKLKVQMINSLYAGCVSSAFVSLFHPPVIRKREGKKERLRREKKK